MDLISSPTGSTVKHLYRSGVPGGAANRLGAGARPNLAALFATSARDQARSDGLAR